MFCYQCQETANNTGCTKVGVCGKRATTAEAMDALLFVTKGVAVAAQALKACRESLPECTHPKGQNESVAHFIADALFTTITNANFDEEVIRQKTQLGLHLRDMLARHAIEKGVSLPQVEELSWDGISPMDQQGALREPNEDLRSLKELVLYGLKGMAAYLEHARTLGMEDSEVDDFICQTLAMLTDRKLSAKRLVTLVYDTGGYGVKAMALLDKANTQAYGNPQIARVSTSVGYRPGILVSGHDLNDLEQLLLQTEREGVDVYTHGEMLPAWGYPQLRKFHHLVGHYGSAWWQQRRDFASFNGPILFTSNCIVPPLQGNDYEARMFTTNAAGYPGCCHIPVGKDGRKDFSPVITLAKRCEAPQPLPPTAIEEVSTLTCGFAHHQMEKLMAPVVDAVRSGKIRKFVVMAGCDGRLRSREYYTEFARRLPPDTVILTAGCAKYRYNRLRLGDIDGIPRVLDAGQCNDSYSLVLTALRLKELLGLKSVNDLPIVFNIAWYEQKAVIVLLSLLSLGIRNIHLGPSLPAFVSPGVLNVLVDKFDIGTISTPEEDLKKWGLTA